MRDVTVLLSFGDDLAGARALPQKAEQEREGFFFSFLYLKGAAGGRNT